jgi:hypothetical protein
MKCCWLLLTLLIVLAVTTRAAEDGPALSPPAQILARGKPISVDVGHAAPCYADIDGSGKPVLLVGQFGEGKLRIYPNQGTAKEPRFGEFTWFQAGGKDGKVPTG